MHKSRAPQKTKTKRELTEKYMNDEVTHKKGYIEALSEENGNWKT